LQHLASGDRARALEYLARLEEHEQTGDAVAIAVQRAGQAEDAGADEFGQVRARVDDRMGQGLSQQRNRPVDAFSL